MANETTTGTLTSDLAAAAATAYLLTLADRNALPNHPALFYAGSINQRRSNVINVATLDLAGAVRPARVNQATTPPRTVIGDGQILVTVHEHRKTYAPGDLVRIIMGDLLDPMMLAQDAAASAAMNLTNLIANVVDGFAATAGPGTGVDADVPSLLAAIGALEPLNVDASGGFLGMLHGQQWADLTVDFAAVGGAIPFIMGNESLMTARGGGFKGRWLGVDWYSSNQVPAVNAGADRGGGIWARGGVVWADGAFPVDDPANQISLAPSVLFERGRDVEQGITLYATQHAVGVSLGLEAGVTYISDL